MSYSFPINHQSMIFDDTRNQIYADAIKTLVDQNSVVMDLGAGLGLHGLIAARAGARMVYLIEPEPVIHVAARLAEENGLSGNTECIQAKIESLELPQPVDLIISVFTGNFLLQEDLLPSLIHARDKHLALNGRMIPDQAKMFVQPISAEEFYKKNIDCWCERSQDFSFSFVRKHAANTIYQDDYKDLNYKALASPAEILHMDFMTATSTDCKTRTTMEIETDGICHGFLGWFDMRLGQHWLSTSPRAKKTHWRQVYLPIDPSLKVREGQQLTFCLQRPQFGEWTWSIETEGRSQRHSTFLSGLLQHSDLAKKSDTYKPALTEKGRLARHVLELFDGNTAAGLISKEISSSEDTHFKSEAEAKRFVTGLINRYG